MKYRPLSPTGDYTIGQPFYNNVPAAPAQAILTRLKLWQGEWFVDTSDGTPYPTEVLGERRPGKSPDAAIQRRILGTLGVSQILSYSSQFLGNSRTLQVSASVQSIYSTTPISFSTQLEL